MLAYTGIETISNMAEEAKDEATTIPAAIKRVRIAVFAIYFTLPAVALWRCRSRRPPTARTRRCSASPRSRAATRATRSLGLVVNLDLGPFQRPAEIYVGLLAATILFLATNAGLIGVSRLVYSMGIHRQMPDSLRRLHPRFRTPWIGILVFGGVAIVLILPGQAVFLGNLYSFGALLSFTIAHLSVLRLRVRSPTSIGPTAGRGT